MSGAAEGGVMVGGHAGRPPPQRSGGVALASSRLTLVRMKRRRARRRLAYDERPAAGDADPVGATGQGAGDETADLRRDGRDGPLAGGTGTGAGTRGDGVRARSG